jgi:hypothetical protein
VQNDTGLGQRVTFRVATGGNRYAYLRIGNASSAAQTFRVRGSSGRDGISLSYEDLGLDVTDQVVAGTYSVTVRRSSSRVILVHVRAARTSVAGEQESFRFRAVNSAEPTLLDVVRATVTVGPLTVWGVNYSGTLRCTASFPSRAFTPGFETGVSFTLTNLTATTLPPQGVFGYVVFLDGAGHKLWDTAPRYEGPRPGTQGLDPHETVTVYGFDTRTRWSGPLLVRPVCAGLRLRMPTTRFDVSKPGAPDTVADAIDAAVGVPASRSRLAIPVPPVNRGRGSSGLRTDATSRRSPCGAGPRFDRRAGSTSCP